MTYSQDTKKHVQRVLSLCNCLLKNGFTCSVDVQGRKMENCVQSLGDIDWYRQKFVEVFESCIHSVSKLTILEIQ